jgi:hypothetical protein
VAKHRLNDGRKVGQIVTRNMVASANGPNVSSAYFDSSAAHARIDYNFARHDPSKKNPPNMPSEGLNLVQAIATSWRDDSRPHAASDAGRMLLYRMTCRDH